MRSERTNHIRPPPGTPDRRDFLKHLGCLTAAGTGVLTAGNALASETGNHYSLMEQKGIYYYLNSQQLAG